MSVLVVAQDPHWLRLAGAALGRAGVADVRTIRSREQRCARVAREDRAAVVVLEGGLPSPELRRALRDQGAVLVEVDEARKWDAPTVFSARVREALLQHASQRQEARVVGRIG